MTASLREKFWYRVVDDELTGQVLRHTTDITTSITLTIAHADGLWLLSWLGPCRWFGFMSLWVVTWRVSHVNHTHKHTQKLNSHRSGHLGWCRLDCLAGPLTDLPHSPNACQGKSLWWWSDGSCSTQNTNDVKEQPCILASSHTV